MSDVHPYFAAHARSSGTRLEVSARLVKLSAVERAELEPTLVRLIAAEDAVTDYRSHEPDILAWRPSPCELAELEELVRTVERIGAEIYAAMPPVAEPPL